MSLLICLSFHYNIDNINFLYKVIDNIIATYDFKTHICVSTNDHRTIELLNKYKDVEVIVHELEHPYHLTYMHRQYMFNNIDNYDIMIYSEDDILIPFKSILDFLEKIKILWPTYIPSFKRCEYSKNKDKYALLDVHGNQVLSKDDIIHIDGKRYITPAYPNMAYQGFWILPTTLLKENMSNFLNINLHREHAASYTLGPPPFHNYEENYKGGFFLNKIPLLELNENDQIHEICIVYHTPNRYVDVSNTPTIDEFLIYK